MKIKLVVVDNRILFYDGIKLICQQDPAFEIVGVADNLKTAIKVITDTQPNIVLFEADLPNLDPLEFAQHVLNIVPSCKLAILTMHASQMLIKRLLAAGVKGLILKNTSAKDFLAMLHQLAQDEIVISASVAQKMAISQIKNKKNFESPFEVLTNRELQIMTMICKGLNINEISENLFISDKTVHTYRYKIYKKLNIDSDIKLTHLAIRHHLITI